ncbi:hypothetical protein IFM89_011869 [Coptis chinensis]|uniref:CCG-binding protein 1 n=1 Tax=Coptis chinensis TaxID=261450 RepID=A0A835M2Z6_9MAGN|nr:hypothetical protein IFM89_011869 [Coptis chinensis]
MMKSITHPSSSSSSLLFQSSNLSRSRKLPTNVCYSSLRSKVYIPKLEPFSSRSKMDRCVKEPSLIEKSEHELLDYCSVLEGDESFNCWKAYFELKDLEREMSKEEVEKLIHETQGVKSLIDYVHGVSSILHKKKNEEIDESVKGLDVENGGKKVVPFPVPDGLPKTDEELEEDEKGRMPDSPFTRLLRNKGRLPAWFSQAPDHETD